MADIKTAEQISRKVRALKYFNGVIETADKKGSAIIKLNCTGAEFILNKGDVLYLKVKTMIAKLSEEIASLEIVQRATVAQTQSQPARRRVAPAPIGAAPEQLSIEEETRLSKKERQRGYQKKWIEKCKNLGVKRLRDLSKDEQ